MSAFVPPVRSNPLARVVRFVQVLVVRRRNCHTLSAAARATHSESDLIAYSMDEWLLRHPKTPVSTDDDYPSWTPGGAE
ncbi:hypothetical protein ACH40F_08320 [Streptomyces sp. NPDC020794]|uniref:hypothetical protein n=1 Tax=unclassified Streptomyces TaxID=2593676 RepID=UPI0036E77E64